MDNKSNYIYWIFRNKKMIMRLLEDLTFGFDDYHKEIIKERIEMLIDEHGRGDFP